MKFSIFIILIFFQVTFAKNRIIIDKNLYEFRQEYREYKWVAKILSDKSFFEIYNAVGIELKIIEKQMIKISNIWKTWTLKFDENALKSHAKNRYKMTKENVHGLFQGTSKIHQKGLNIIFSGDLTSTTPPMKYLDDLFDEIEVKVEDVWKYYLNNSACVAPMFKKFLPLFDPTVNKIIKLGKDSAKNIPIYYFKRCKSLSLESKNHVENLIDKMDKCVLSKDIDLCVIKVVSKFHNFFKTQQFLYFYSRLKKKLNVMQAVGKFIHQ